jgi:hypothetical protein
MPIWLSWILWALALVVLYWEYRDQHKRNAPRIRLYAHLLLTAMVAMVFLDASGVMLGAQTQIESIALPFVLLTSGFGIIGIILLVLSYLVRSNR